MTSLELNDYLKINRVTPADLSRKLDVSPQLVSFWRRSGKMQTYVEYDVRTGTIKKVWAEKVTYLNPSA